MGRVVVGPRVPAGAILALILTLVVSASGCASNPKRRASVPIDSRPTPVQPDESAADSARAVPMTERTRSSAAERITADTLAVRKALDECQGVKLLPDQEGIVDSANALLVRVRAAIASGDLAAAESRARQARQMVASLRCK